MKQEIWLACISLLFIKWILYKTESVKFAISLYQLLKTTVFLTHNENEI